jgi:site-specific DNA-methyltransferase (adenine-specific)
MPFLHWPSKTTPKPISAELAPDCQVFPQGTGYPDTVPENRLILGDNLAIMSALLPEYEGRIKLIYTDPPFFTNRRFPARVGRGEDSRRPQDWKLAEGYQDNWASIDEYLNMLYPRLYLMHRLLAPDGSLYLHLDWHANHYARLLLDEIFGPEQFLNEIIWVYHGPSPIRSAFNRKHDTILCYTKGKDYTFNADEVREPYNPNTVKTFASSRKAGFGKVPDLKRGKVPEDWWYYPVVARLHGERTGYPTQKPEALLERIILASSNPGDLVADFFCGSGTTACAASKSGRNFIASDATWRAIHTTRSRLVRARAKSFTLERVSQLPELIQPAVDDLVPEICLDSANARIVLKSAPPTLEYWEIDPDYDRQVFRSAAQAVRPLKKAEIQSELELKSLDPGKKVAVRLLYTNGDQNQTIIEQGKMES